jgi:hypothetical protein
MRFFGTRTVATVMIVGAALAVSACGKSSTDTVDNSTVTGMNGSMEGTTNDMSTIDSETGNVIPDANATDPAAAADNATADNSTGNAM